MRDMSKKPNGKKPKQHPVFTNLKQARAECREQALKRGCHSWPLCWTPNTGYYCPDYEPSNGIRTNPTNYVCLVDKSGALTYVSKAVQKVHNFKHYTNPPWYHEGK